MHFSRSALVEFAKARELLESVATLLPGEDLLILSTSSLKQYLRGTPHVMSLTPFNPG